MLLPAMHWVIESLFACQLNAKNGSALNMLVALLLEAGLQKASGLNQRLPSSRLPSLLQAGIHRLPAHA